MIFLKTLGLMGITIQKFKFGQIFIDKISDNSFRFAHNLEIKKGNALSIMKALLVNDDMCVTSA